MNRHNKRKKAPPETVKVGHAVVKIYPHRKRIEGRKNDNHGSKVIVVPFDGVAFDRDMQALAGIHRQRIKITLPNNGNPFREQRVQQISGVHFGRPILFFRFVAADLLQGRNQIAHLCKESTTRFGNQFRWSTAFNFGLHRHEISA